MIPDKQALVDVAHLSIGEQGRMFKVDGRTVSRWRKRYELSDPTRSPRLTPAQERRAAVLAREGMPLLYVSADVRVNVKCLQRRFSPNRAADEWRRVWPEILRNPALLALHHEFFPPVPTSKKDRINHEH